MNDRLPHGTFELGQHGTYHAPIQPEGLPLSEMTGYDPLEMFVYMKVGQDTMLGDYTARYVEGPASGPALDWTSAALPLISFAPPYDEYDRAAAQGTALLGYKDFTSDIFVEGLPRTGMPSYVDEFDPFGMLHTPATFMPGGKLGEWPAVGYDDYATYIEDNLTAGEPNVLLLEEVNFSERVGTTVDNTIDPDRWGNFQTMLQVVKDFPGAVHMTLAEYAMARSYDNAPNDYNPDQKYWTELTAQEFALKATPPVDGKGVPKGAFIATLTDAFTGEPLADMEVEFLLDLDGDGEITAEEVVATATTDADGVAWAELPKAAGKYPVYKARFAGTYLYGASTEEAAMTAPPRVK